jgi:hypothetical protein
MIDDTVAVSYNLNDFFTYDLNQYQSGMIQYPLPVLAEGKHRLIIKAWDLLGNVSKDTIWVEVPGAKNKQLRNLNIAPNPVQNHARISFEVKNVLDPIQMQLEIFDASGRVHFSTRQSLQPAGNRVVIDWDGLSSNGTILPAGKYYYKVVVSQNGLSEQLINTLLKF